MTDKKQNGLNKWLPAIVLLGILAAGAYLRFHNLTLTPGWWPDEGVMLNISNNLLHGRAQFFVFNYTFVPHPPLYFLISALWIQFLGPSILTMRLLSATIGILAILFLYLSIREVGNRFGALVGAAIFATFPFVLVQSRIGLSYHLLTLFFILTTYFILKSFNNPDKLSYFYAACLFAGLAPTIEYLGIAAPIAVFLIYLLTGVRKKINFFTVIAILGLPFVIYLGTILSINAKATIQDIQYMFSRPGGKSSFNDSFLKSFKLLLATATVLVPGAIGLIFAKRGQRFFLVFFLAIIIFFEFYSRGFWWYVSTYMFLFCLGWGILASLPAKIMPKNPIVSAGTAIITLVLLLLVFVPSAQKSFATVSSGKFFGLSEETSFSPSNQVLLDSAIQYINSRVTPNDMIIASPHLSWMVNAVPSDPIMSYVYTGKATTNFPANTRSTGRFLYDPSYQKAKYLLEDDFVRNWFVYQPGIKEGVLDPIYKNWKLVFDNGEFSIFENPVLNKI